MSNHQNSYGAPPAEGGDESRRGGEGNNDGTNGIGVVGMGAGNNGTTTTAASLDSQDSAAMDGIEWDEESVRKEEES